MQDTILVLSRNTSLAGLIARTLRWRQVYCTLLPFESAAAQISEHSPRGIILAEEGNGENALDGLDLSLLASSTPVLALGGSAIALCRYYGGEANEAEPVKGGITLGLSDGVLFAGISGGERMIPVPADLTLSDDLTPLATATERIIGFRHRDLPLYGLQYAVERNDPDAAQLLYNFACGVCGCKADWDEDAIIAQAVTLIRETARDGRVMCAVSGGVDSAVCARLAQLAVGERLVCVFVDTGFFRMDEPQSVLAGYMDTMDLAVAYVDAKEAFLRALSGVGSPKDKERISSTLMTQVLLKQLSYDPDIHTVVIGANLNDLLFGFSLSAGMEKWEEKADLRVCEPINRLLKDEVRRVAKALELPNDTVQRHHFPDSGLALRILGNVTEERLDVLRAADACFSEEVHQGGYEKRLWQYYATLMENPGAPGEYTVCLRALQTAQGGAHAARLPFDVLERATARIRAEVHGISRVVYDLTPCADYGHLE